MEERQRRAGQWRRREKDSEVRGLQNRSLLMRIVDGLLGPKEGRSVCVRRRSVCVCNVCMCVYVCVYVCHVCMCVYVCMCMCHVCMCVCVSCVHVCICVRVSCVHVCMCKVTSVLFDSPNIV